MGPRSTKKVLNWIFSLSSISFNSNHLIRYRPLRELTIGVMGIGTIGGCVIQTSKNMNMNVWALSKSTHSIRKNQCPADKFFTMEQLPEFLGGCDYVVNALPSTPETRSIH